MKYLKMLGLAACAAAALMAFVGVGSASATTLEVGGVTQNQSISIVATLTSGSLLMKDTNNLTTDTCSGSEIKGATQSPYSGSTVTAAVGTLTLTGCSHTSHTLKAGTLHIAWSSGTNGTVSSSGAEVTFKSTVFGISCVAKTGAGTTLGTIIGSGEGHAVININAVINLGICGTSTWTGTYTLTTPTGLGVES